MARKPSVIDKLTIFVDNVTKGKGQFTVAQLCDILDCNATSISPTLSWMRRNGYVVALSKSWLAGVYLYEIHRGSAKALERQTAKSKDTLERTRLKLETRLGRR